MRNVEDIYALTPMQRLMLVHVLRDPTADVLGNRVAYEIRGPLEEASFRRAWEALVDRHAALRTLVLWEGLDEPVQVVRNQVELPFATLDLAGLPATERDNRIDEIWDGDLARPFDLGRPPLMRCTLVRAGPEHHVLLWNIHHLIVDRWSARVLMSDLAAIYGALLAGATPRMDPPVPFRDYVAWLRAQDPAEAERYWRQELEGFTEPTLLADGAGEELDAQTVVVAEDAVGSLLDRASAWRVSPASLLLAAIGLEVARRTARDDVVFGLTVSGRPPDLPGVDAAVGCFVNNVPLRARIPRDRSLREWVREVARGQFRRQRFDHVSPASLRDWASVPAGRPLFDLLVVLNLEPAEDGDWPVDVTPVRATLATAYPLNLAVTADARDLRMVLGHRAGWQDGGELLRGIAASLRTVVEADPAPSMGSLMPHPEPSRAGGPVEVRGSRVVSDEAGLRGAIQGIWKEVLGQAEIGLDDDFFALGGTSLDAVRLFARVESAAGRALPLSTLVETPTVRAMLAALGEPASPDGPVVTLTPGGPEPPLFAVPGIDGRAASLLPLAREMPRSRPFLAFQSRGLDGTDTPLESIEAIAEEYCRAVLAAGHERFHLLGACWGGAVAVEMARRLAAAGRPPASVAVLDPPVLLRQAGSRRPKPLLALVRARARQYGRLLVRGSWSERRRLAGRLATLAGGLVRSRGLPEDAQPDLVRRTVRLANVHAIERYDPPVIEARTRLFITGDRVLGDGADPRLEWLSLIRPRPEVHTVPGSDSGDAITANVIPFGAALSAWLKDVEEAEELGAGTGSGGVERG